MEKNLRTKNAIYGRRNVKEFLRHFKGSDLETSDKIQEILIKKNPSREVEKEILSDVPKGIRITYISGGEFDLLFPGVNHQGVAVVSEKLKPNSKALDFCRKHAAGYGVATEVVT